ncbi:MAG: hypothetical protein Q7R58_02565 [bacterium]|nr:hypothetical protein [bacterium]
MSSNTMSNTNWFARLCGLFFGEPFSEGVRLYRRQDKPRRYEYDPRVVVRQLNTEDIKNRLLAAGIVEDYGFTRVRMTPGAIKLEGPLYSPGIPLIIQLLKSGGARLVIPHFAEHARDWNRFALALGEILRAPKKH